MKSKRKILISLIVIAFLGYAVVVNEKNSSTSNNTSSFPQSQSIKFTNSLPQHSPQGTSDLNRDEVLKKSLKGYREQTYWGNEHPVKEITKDLNDKEFNRFVEDEIKSKDVDVFWGAEY